MRPPLAGPPAPAAPQTPQGPSSSSSSSSGSSSVSRNWGFVQKVSDGGGHGLLHLPWRLTPPVPLASWLHRSPQASPAPGWLPPELKPRTQRPWKVLTCQAPPAGLGPSTSGLSEHIWTVLKWCRKSWSSILCTGSRTPKGPRSECPQRPHVLPSSLQLPEPQITELSRLTLPPASPRLLRHVTQHQDSQTC